MSAPAAAAASAADHKTTARKRRRRSPEDDGDCEVTSAGAAAAGAAAAAGGDGGPAVPSSGVYLSEDQAVLIVDGEASLLGKGDIIRYRFSGGADLGRVTRFVKTTDESVMVLIDTIWSVAQLQTMNPVIAKLFVEEHDDDDALIQTHNTWTVPIAQVLEVADEDADPSYEWTTGKPVRLIKNASLPDRDDHAPRLNGIERDFRDFLCSEGRFLFLTKAGERYAKYFKDLVSPLGKTQFVAGFLKYLTSAALLSEEDDSDDDKVASVESWAVFNSSEPSQLPSEQKCSACGRKVRLFGTVCIAGTSDHALDRKCFETLQAAVDVRLKLVTCWRVAQEDEDRAHTFGPDASLKSDEVEALMRRPKPRGTRLKPRAAAAAAAAASK
jgi:hypothetical protein